MHAADGNPPDALKTGPAQVASVLDQLACPVCFAQLAVDAARLVCSGCGRTYPIIDGIPVLIADPPEP
jgi:hypothetical protein